MKKEKIKNILLIVIVALVTSFVTAYGVSSTFDSSNVCYKVDSNTGASVQDTIDDLYGRASDYSELKSYFQNNPTSRFYGNEIHVGYNTTNGNSSLNLYGTNNKQRASLYYYSGDDTTVLTARNSNETNGKGKLNLAGNPVTINGADVMSNLQSGNETWWGVYPSGKNANVTFTSVSIPINNVNLKNYSINNVWVYDSGGNFVEITNSVTVDSSSQSFIDIRITFNSAYAGRLMRVDFIN